MRRLLETSWSGSTCHAKISRGLRLRTISQEDHINMFESIACRQSDQKELAQSSLEPSKKVCAKQKIEMLVKRLIGKEYNMGFASLTRLIRC